MVRLSWYQVSPEKVITEVTLQGPAAIAGLMVGDQLSKINGVSLHDWSLGNIKAAFKQEKGTVINVEVLRSFEPFQTTMTVDDIETFNYDIQLIQPGFIYISIKRFDGNVVVQW